MAEDQKLKLFLTLIFVKWSKKSTYFKNPSEPLWKKILLQFIKYHLFEILWSFFLFYKKNWFEAPTRLFVWLWQKFSLKLFRRSRRHRKRTFPSTATPTWSGRRKRGTKNQKCLLRNPPSSFNNQHHQRRRRHNNNSSRNNNNNNHHHNDLPNKTFIKELSAKFSIKKVCVSTWASFCPLTAQSAWIGPTTSCEPGIRTDP